MGAGADKRVWSEAGAGLLPGQASRWLMVTAAALSTAAV